VKDAVVRLGGERLSKYLFSRWLGGSVKVPLRAYGIDASRFWSHGVIVALACETLSRDNDPARVSFSAGLLHDIGKVVLDHFALRLGMTVDWAAVPDAAELLEQEKKLFGMDHGEIGATIMRNWNFPDAVIDAALAMQGNSVMNPLLVAAHEIDAWVVEVELQLEEPRALPMGVTEQQAGHILCEYQSVRAAIGV
jgi:putative nucleotidyltransferase with HDIG domain